MNNQNNENKNFSKDPVKNNDNNILNANNKNDKQNIPKTNNTNILNENNNYDKQNIQKANKDNNKINGNNNYDKSINESVKKSINEICEKYYDKLNKQLKANQSFYVNKTSRNDFICNIYDQENLKTNKSIKEMHTISCYRYRNRANDRNDFTSINKYSEKKPINEIREKYDKSNHKLKVIIDFKNGSKLKKFKSFNRKPSDNECSLKKNNNYSKNINENSSKNIINKIKQNQDKSKLKIYNKRILKSSNKDNIKQIVSKTDICFYKHKNLIKLNDDAKSKTLSNILPDKKQIKNNLSIKNNKYHLRWQFDSKKQKSIEKEYEKKIIYTTKIRKYQENILQKSNVTKISLKGLCELKRDKFQKSNIINFSVLNCKKNNLLKQRYSFTIFSKNNKEKKIYQKEVNNIIEILNKNTFYKEKDFKDIKFIAKGKYGKVYSSYSIKDNKEVCLKTIDLDFMKRDYNLCGYPEDSYERDLNNEIEILKLLSENKYSVKYYGNFDKIVEKTIIMEKCDDNLEDFLNQRGKYFNTEEIKNIFVGINKIFKIMKIKHIIHRDLKLKNFLIKYLDEEKSKYIIKIADYGIGKFLSKENNGFSGYKGTPEYMAPEILLGQVKEYRNSNDIFSLGVILYQLAHKLSFPFPKENMLMIYANFYDKDDFDIEFDKSIKSEEYKNLVRQMLKINPKNRLNWDQYFEHSFFR